jgi:glycosyltransferase involved in cell wall biosynthesis
MIAQKVSICIPTYNMASFIGLVVQSALDQTYSNFEIVICDNASTDKTPDILAQFQDPRIKIFTNSENVGAIGNFNLAIERASSEWIKFLEADDLLDPTCLEKCVQVVEQDSEVDVVSVGRTRVYEDGTPFLREVHRDSEIVAGMAVRRRVHLRHNEFGTPTDVMVRKELLQRVGGFDTDFGTYLNDWDLWLRCQEQARKVAFIAESLVQVRSHGGQIGATSAKANIDIDVLFLMLQKRWDTQTVRNFMWWQGAYLKLVLSAPYIYRGFKQIIRGNMISGISKWDAWQRLYRHLGLGGFVVSTLFSVFLMPLYPWYEHHVGNGQRISRGEPIPPTFRGSGVFASILLTFYFILGVLFVNWLWQLLKIL